MTRLWCLMIQFSSLSECTSRGVAKVLRWDLARSSACCLKLDPRKYWAHYNITANIYTHHQKGSIILVRLLVNSGILWRNDFFSNIVLGLAEVVHANVTHGRPLGVRHNNKYMKRSV